MHERAEVMTVAEFAHRARIGKRQAYEAIRRGEVPGVIRIGHTIRISVAAWEAWISQETIGRTADDGG